MQMRKHFTTQTQFCHHTTK